MFGERLRDAFALTPSLISGITSEVHRRFASQVQAGKTTRVDQLMRVGAWTDAALALIELELPQWKIRRLVYDDGEWHCALSRRCQLPDWLDQSVEGRHTDLALAILSAFVAVPRSGSSLERTGEPAAGRSENQLYEPLLADNLA